MRILHLRATNFYGGPERQIHLHALRQQGGDNKVWIASYLENGRVPELLQLARADGIDTHAFLSKSAYDMSVITKIRSFLASNDIDVLCTHEYRSHFLGWIATRRQRTKWLAFSRGWTTESIKVRAYHTIDKVILRFADHVVAVSGVQRDRLLRIRIPKSRISVVHNAIDIDKITAAERVDLRSRFMLAAGTRVVVCVGRFSSEKGQAIMVKAAESALKANAGLRVIMFGDGPDLRKIKSMIGKRGLHDRVFCPGFERNAAGCIRGADLLVNPSLSEGLPNVVLEAMALGVPVVATDVGGVSELIDHSRTGWLVPANNVRALRDAVLEAVEDDGKAHLCVDNARVLVKQQFNFSVQNDRLRNVYSRVAVGE